VSFAHIEGHERPIAILKRALANRTMAHAYLFSGPEGAGKKLAAFALAAAINCDRPGPDGGCGQCSPCRRTLAGIHPDVHIVMPESENERLLAAMTAREAGKASSEIKIDQIRQAQESLSLKPSEGSKKFLIVDGADTLNTAAQNAFLKTLEEPPGDALIVLITAMPQSLLPTIRSRCQEIRFQPLSRSRMAHALVERRGISEDDAWFLAALAQGSMGRGLDMDLEQEKAARQEVLSLWGHLTGQSPAGVLAQAEAVSRDRQHLERLISIGIEWLRDALVLRESGDERLLVNNADRERCRQWAGQVGTERMLADLELFVASQGMIERRVSAQLVAEHLFLNLARR
jgi:DNA polymerase-3 subunit delta'